MRQWLSLFCALMLAVMLWTGGAAHAAEAFGCVEAGAESFGESGGQRDQIPADTDKAVSHHHGGCHGHHVAIPSTAAGDVESLFALGATNAAPPFMVTGGEPGTALRPPIA